MNFMESVLQLRREMDPVSATASQPAPPPGALVYFSHISVIIHAYRGFSISSEAIFAISTKCSIDLNAVANYRHIFIVITVDGSALGVN